jgi:hypothetical protein
MIKIAFVVAAAVLTTTPLVTPAKARGVKMAQVDMQTGRHVEDRDPGYHVSKRDNTRWICVNHLEGPFLGERACGCGAAGAPCPNCK